VRRGRAQQGPRLGSESKFKRGRAPRRNPRFALYFSALSILGGCAIFAGALHVHQDLCAPAPALGLRRLRTGWLLTLRGRPGAGTPTTSSRRSRPGAGTRPRHSSGSCPSCSRSTCRRQRTRACSGLARARGALGAGQERRSCSLGSCEELCHALSACLHCLLCRGPPFIVAAAVGRRVQLSQWGGRRCTPHCQRSC